MGANVGIDVSKEHLDWTVGAKARVRRVSHDAAGIRRLVRALSGQAIVRVVLESTGGYERRLVEALRTAGLPVVVVNPWRVRRFGEGLGILAKTDPIDAQVLALFGERAEPPIRPVEASRSREAADLVARRRQLVAMVVAEKSRLDKAPAWLRRDIQSLVRILERRIAKIDDRLDAVLAVDAERQETRAILESVPSVGPGVARSLLVDLPELGRLSRRRIAALVGLAPYARDSGRRSGTRRIRGGRPGPRSMLYLAAMTGARFNPVLRELYQRLRAAGKPPKLAFVAVARKLLVILNAMVRDRTPWRAVPA